MLTLMILLGLDRFSKTIWNCFRIDCASLCLHCLTLDSSVNRHMPKTVEESLLGDHSDQWMDSDCPEAKRLKVSYTAFLQ